MARREAQAGADDRLGVPDRDEASGIADYMDSLRGISEADMQALVDYDGGDLVQQVRTLLLRVKCCLYHKPNSRTLCQPGANQDEHWAKPLEPARTDAIRRFRAPNLSVSCLDYTSVFLADAMGANPRSVMYCDPPYYDPRPGNEYRDLYGEHRIDHDNLAEWLIARRAPWLLSMNACAWLDDHFPDQRRISMRLKWRMSAMQRRPLDARDEVLVIGP